MNSRKINVKYIYLITIIFVFLFLRISFLLTNIDPIFAYEERTNGAIAKDIINSEVKMPLYDYQVHPHSGGTLVAGILTTPVFFLFGTSLISLKLLPLFFSLGTLLLWYKFLKTYFSQSAALLFSALFIFSPPFYTKNSLIAWGNHCESNFLSILTITFFFKAFFTDEEKNKGKIAYIILFGLLSGVSTYFSYLYLLTLLTLFVFWFISDKLFFLNKYFFIYLFFFFLGFTPWIGYNIYKWDTNKFNPFSKTFLSTFEPKYNIIDFLKNFYHIVFKDIPISLEFDILNWKGKDTVSYAYLFLFLLFFIILILTFRKATTKALEKKVKLLPIIYFIIFLLIFTFSGFYNPKLAELEWFHVSKYRYYSPLYPFIFLTIAIGLKTIWSDFNKYLWKGFVILSCIFLMTAGLYSNLRFIKFDNAGKGFAFKGYWYDELLPRYIKKHGNNFEEINYLIGRIDREYIPEYYELIGIDFGKQFSRNIIAAVKVVNKAKPEYRRYLYSGIGRACIIMFKEDINETIKLIEKLPDSYRGYCYQGVFYEALINFHKYSPLDNGWSSKWDISKVLFLLNRVDEAYKPACYFGLGRGIMSFEFYYAESRMYLFSDLVMKSGKAIKEIEDKYKGFYFQGVGIEYGKKVCDYFFVRSYFQPEDGYGLENKFYSEALEKEIARIIKGDKTLAEEDKKNYYKGIRMAVSESFRDVRVMNFILSKISKREFL